MLEFSTDTILGFISLIIFSILCAYLFNKLTHQLNEQNESFVLRFGKVVNVINKPGLHWLPIKILPWVEIITISKKLDYRLFKGIHVNDNNGTSMVLDLWVEFRITDGHRAIFGVENWEDVLKNSVIHSTTSIISADDLTTVLKHRNELSEKIQDEISNETSRWGITLHGVMIQNIGLLPEVSKQLFQSVAARIEKTTALIQEQGRLNVSMLDAETARKVADLNATARSQIPLEIGKFYRNLANDPMLLKKFNEYWELTNLNPKNTVTFSNSFNETIDMIESTKIVESVISH